LNELVNFDSGSGETTPDEIDLDPLNSFLYMSCAIVHNQPVCTLFDLVCLSHGVHCIVNQTSYVIILIIVVFELFVLPIFKIAKQILIAAN